VGIFKRKKEVVAFSSFFSAHSFWDRADFWPDIRVGAFYLYAFLIGTNLWKKRAGIKDEEVS
jgi:hypothetical protein